MTAFSPNQIEARIAMIDSHLHVLRAGWMSACKDRKAQWMEQINCALMDRAGYMAMRQQPAAT